MKGAVFVAQNLCYSTARVQRAGAHRLPGFAPPELCTTLYQQRCGSHVMVHVDLQEHSSWVRTVVNSGQQQRT